MTNPMTMILHPGSNDVELRELRLRWLASYGHNVSALPTNLAHELGVIDLTTDATSDPGFAGQGFLPSSWTPVTRVDPPHRVERSLPFVAGLSAVLCHSGKAAERVWCRVAAAPGTIVPTNAPFPTALLAHLEAQTIMSECCDVAAYRFDRESADRGFIDAERIARLIDRSTGRVRYVWIELACNALAGQPVSLATLRAIREVTQARGVLLVLATTRLLTNAALLQRRDPQLREVSVVDIAALTLGLADVCIGSLSKEYDVGVGGMLAARDPALLVELAAAAALDGSLLPAAWWPVVGRSLGARLGDTRPIERRAEQVERLRTSLCDLGVPGVLETGGHAVYLDAHSLSNEAHLSSLAAESWAAHLFVQAGVRLTPAPTTPTQHTLGVSLLRAAVPIGRYSDEELQRITQRISVAVNRTRPERLVLRKPQAGFDAIAPHHGLFRPAMPGEVIGFSWGQVLQARCERAGNRPLFFAEDDRGSFTLITGNQLYDTIRHIAEGLTSLGLVAGDRVAWRLDNSIEWVILDAACLSLGLIGIPITPSLPIVRTIEVLRQARAHVLVGQGADLAALIEAAGSSENDWPVAWTVSLLGDPALECARSRRWDELIELGRHAARETSAWEAAISARAPADAATWMLTSGTGGTPRLVELTHGNLAAYVTSFRWPFFSARNWFFPLLADLNQSLGRNALYAAVFNGSLTIVIPRRSESAIDDGLFQRFPPACMVAPPRLIARCIEYALAPIQSIALQPQELNRRRAAAISAYFGGRLWFIAYGGAPLSSQLEQLLVSSGVMLADGYGMTECPLIGIRHVRGDDDPLAHHLAPSVRARIAPSGEIEVHGAGVAPRLLDEFGSSGRWTGDGWLRTGDRGHWSVDGLVVEGRLREGLHLADGTYLDPTWLEARLEAKQGIAQALVIGDERPYVAALIVAEEGLHGDPFQMIRVAVDDVNRSLSAAEQIARFEVLESRFAPELVGLTASGEKRRVDRNLAASLLAPQIDALYAVQLARARQND